MGKINLIFKKGKWYNKATGQQFVGKALVNGQWYQYTADGQKIPLKPKPDIYKWTNNLWSFENPQLRGFVNGKYYPFTTANGNIDIGSGIDLSKQTKEFQQRAKQGFTKQQMDTEVNKRAKNAYIICRRKRFFKFIMRFPLRTLYDFNPSFKRGFRISVLFPEIFQEPIME